MASSNGNRERLPYWMYHPGRWQIIAVILGLAAIAIFWLVVTAL